MPELSIYLAGPEVFLPNAEQIGAEKKAICARFGFRGVFPLDGEVAGDLAAKQPGLHGPELARAIYRADCRAVEQCEALIANVTPFRGPSIDPGTAFEMGYARAFGKPVLAYSNVAGDYLSRVQALYERGDATDPNGMTVEDFGLADNLMIDGAVWSADYEILQPKQTLKEGHRFTDLALFTACVERVDHWFQPKT